MTKIILSNQSFNDKVYLDTFARRGKYLHFAIGDRIDSVLVDYKSMLHEAIGDKVDEIVEDSELSRFQTLRIFQVFEKRIEKELLVLDVVQVTPGADIVFKGNHYYLNLMSLDPIGRSIKGFFEVYTIAEECLDEYKPMFLTIK